MRTVDYKWAANAFHMKQNMEGESMKKQTPCKLSVEINPIHSEM
jgi:hypothetical protein